MVATKIPVFILPPAAFETKPIRVGPAEQPMSPARAKSANIVVPPLLIFAAQRLKVPGHIIPTDRPQRAQPTNENTGFFESDAIR